jgi:hypothetical protein
MTTLTIIPDDKIVVVDGIVVVFDFEIDSDIHAVQWNGTEGHIEYKSGKQPLILSDIDDYQSYVTLHGEEKIKTEEAISQDEQDELNQTPTYILNRTTEYGTVGAQLDMIYWDRKNETNNWENHIDVIKNKYPKS